MTHTPNYDIAISTITNARESNQDSGFAFRYDTKRLHVHSTNHNFNNQSHIFSNPPLYHAGAILCDGLHPNGDEASNNMIALFSELIEYHTTAPNTPIERFKVRYYARMQQIHKGATTATLITIDTNHKLDIGYIGDTRLYLAKNANPTNLHLLTRDDTYQRRIVEEKRGLNGLLNPHIYDHWDDPEQLEYIEMPNKSTGHRKIKATSRLTKSLGYLMRQDLQTTQYELPQPTHIEPNDTLILLTDGAYDAFRNKRAELNEIVRTKTPQEATTQILEIAEDWTDDNATAIIIKRTS